LDAIDGTPVIDIKPYIPGYDSAANATTPDWIVREEE
jgi:tRNA (Thr-GGU) A37 N-methylase